MNELASQIEVAISDTMKQISGAAGKGDLNSVEQLTKKATELKGMKDQLLAIESRFLSFENRFQTVALIPHGSAALRELVVWVTQGMINQNLLLLTSYKKLGYVLSGETLSVEALPSGDRFETERLESGRLQERSKIGRFYRDAGVRVGDAVLLSETTPGRWQLKKRT